MASTYLTRTPSSASNRKTWTWSGWVKTATTSGDKGIFSASTDSSNRNAINLSTDAYFIFDYEVGGTRYIVSSQDAKYRDTNGWYHLVVAVDTTQATDTNRVKMYVNGSQITLTTILNGYPLQNADMFINNNISHSIGRQDWGTNYFDGSMAHVHFIDGTAYDASTFGEYDSTTGIWKPKFGPSVTYGTNGFFLKFENSGAFGTDSSGNSNNFTVNGTMTQTIDTPSNVFATISPIDIPTNSSGSSGTLPTLSNGNLSVVNTNSAFREARSSYYLTTGKWYWETKMTRLSNTLQVGVVLNNYSAGSGERRMYQNNGFKYIPSSSSYGATFTTNDIIGIALNLDDGEITFYKNGTTQGVAATDLVSGIDDTGWTPAVNCFDADCDFNFGNGYFGTTAVSSAQNPDDGIGIFEYDVPNGYRALCTKSINAEEYS